MNHNDTTIRHDPVRLAQSELDAAWGAFEQAKAAYMADRSDVNFEALKSAQMKFLHVETEITEARHLLIEAAARRGAL